MMSRTRGHRLLFGGVLYILFCMSCAHPSSQVLLTIDQPLSVLSPSIVGTIQVAIPPEANLNQIAKVLSNTGFGEEAEMFRALQSKELRDEYASSSSSLEGYIIAGQYKIARGLDAIGTVRSLLEQSRQIYKTPERNAKAEYFGLDAHKVLVLASILNKETCGTDEFRRMSSVLQNRLAIGMPLQVDASLVYFLNKPGTQLSKADVQTPSPYNTYLNKGLPPSPICSPTLASIDAVLNPEMDGYLYFYATGRCQHKFSKNYRSHKVAIKSLNSPSQATYPSANKVVAPPKVPAKSLAPGGNATAIAENNKPPTVWDLFSLHRKVK